MCLIRLMSNSLDKLSQIHDLVIEQVLEDLQNGDRKARSEAMALLKQNNITATAGEGTMLSKLAGKLDFSGMADRVVEFKKPPVLTPPPTAA